MNTLNIKFTAHLTENHQLKAADALIAKLRLELGQEKSYTEELHEEMKNMESAYHTEINHLQGQIDSKEADNNRLREKIQELNNRIVALNNKYSDDVNKELKKDELYKRYAEKAGNVISEYKKIAKRNEELIQTIIKLREKYEGNIG